MQIETKNKNVRNLTGLHLYHDPLSSCAMRVRMVLVEKKLPWASHVIDLSKMEHATPEYQSINPNGLVQLWSMTGTPTTRTGADTYPCRSTDQTG